jgi:murein DD-endopeptidase MepM/ murein hydrolase activator NlpD
VRSAAWSGDWAVTQPWGFTDLDVEPWYQGRHWHCGIDIGMPVGTPLFAARAGKVMVRTFGILGVLTSSNQTDYYIHGDYSVLLGDKVVKGTRLGTSGARVPGGGSLTGPHLHFEIQGPTGYLNEPTGLDPVPILTPGLFSSGGATLSPDMTPEEHDWLAALVKAVPASAVTDIPAIAKAIPADLITRLEALKAETEALSASSGTVVDLTPVLTAVASLKGGLDYIKTIVDKLDRGD